MTYKQGGGGEAYLYVRAILPKTSLINIKTGLNKMVGEIFVHDEQTAGTLVSRGMSTVFLGSVDPLLPHWNLGDTTFIHMTLSFLVTPNKKTTLYLNNKERVESAISSNKARD